MTVKTARHQLEAARIYLKSFQREVNRLRQYIIDKGAEPDLRKPRMRRRNKKIYKRWKGGLNFKQLSKRFELSSDRIAQICRRIDRILEIKNASYKEYKDLLPYKNNQKRS